MGVEVRPTPSWQGRYLASLSDEELLYAIKFCSTNYTELSRWAPVLIWSYFSGLLADLTIEQAKRLKGK
jgi:hypothetical protein